MSNTNVTKGERLLKFLAQAPTCELTSEGAAFVQQRFDPYHDKPMKPAGYPDSYNGSTVSRCIKKSIAISAPIAQTAPWDLHVVMTPLQNVPSFTTNINGSNFSVQVDNPQEDRSFGGLHIVKNALSGQNFTLLPLDSTEMSSQLSLTDEDLSDCMRITSMGFEIIDGTAALYKQGIMTTYRMNEPQKQEARMESYQAAVVVGPPVLVGHQEGIGRLIRMPPVNTQQAMLIPNTKQWKVSEGCYVSCDYNDSELPMSNPDNSIVALTNYDNDLPIQQSTIVQYINRMGGNWIDTTFSSTNGMRNYVTPNNKFVPINMTGAICTGLNPLATITVNAIWYVECAPGGEDEELLSLCSQSPAYDTFAMMAISKLRRDSPVAVKLAENYMGEWFVNGMRDLVQKVTPWLSNAQTVGNQIVKWADTASTNDGFINPQSFVKGPVSQKINKEKNPQGKGDPGRIVQVIRSGPMKRGPVPKAPQFKIPRGPAFSRTKLGPKTRINRGKHVRTGDGSQIRARVAKRQANTGFYNH